MEPIYTREQQAHDVITHDVFPLSDAPLIECALCHSVICECFLRKDIGDCEHFILHKLHSSNGIIYHCIDCEREGVWK